ncbi:MAG: SHOCT domain-containing protein [Tissierella sp.]|uniref:SHOCT domain-containing protein n=1 Tax=Tissierella sp. TaxID=41274 RepID=UPI003F96C5B9
MMYGGYGMFVGGLLCLIIIGMIAYFIINIFNKNEKNSNVSGTKASAIDLLNERYVNGEIDEEEYNRRKEVLKD